jgi:hypothetical protein
MAQDRFEEARRALEIPFSDDELLAAYRLSLSDAEAQSGRGG